MNTSDHTRHRNGSTVVTRRRLLTTLTGLSLSAAGGLPAAAQAWPAGKTITYVVPFPAGGLTDILARLISAKLGPALGTTIIVDNKPGATGTIGADLVARSAPDGLTLMGSVIGPMAVLPAAGQKLSYDAITSFTPVTLIGQIPSVLVVPANSPWQSAQDVVLAARAKPGSLTFGSGGSGTMLHMAAELFRVRAGVDLLHVPYKGDPPALQDVIAGHINFMFAPAGSAQPHIQAGRVRALAVTAANRLKTLPDVPTLDEAGIAEAQSAQWQGIHVVKGTPPAIVQRLHAEIVKILREPEVAERLDKLGVDVAANTPDEFAAFQKADIVKWTKVIASSGLKLE
jgi:tripartite-type tricarboxylate transporter receptor subunit TctC